MHGSLSFRLPSLMPRAVPGPRPQRSGTARPRIGPAAEVAVRLQAGASGRQHHKGLGGMAVPLGPASADQPPFGRPPIGNSKAIRLNRGPQLSLTVFTVA